LGRNEEKAGLGSRLQSRQSKAEPTRRKLTPTPLLLLCLLTPANLYAESCCPDPEPPDFTGYWDTLMYQDYLYRWDGPEKGDYRGLPLTETARRIADQWDPLAWEEPEEQCKPHGAAYVMQGPSAKQFVYEEDGHITINVELDGQVRKIYMDGRPWPGGELQWQGHSTGKWEGETLTVVTTHIRPRYLRRNGVYHSADLVMTEHFVRDGDILTVTQIIEDPQTLTEPLVLSLNYRRLPDDYNWQPWECYPIEWPGGTPGAPEQ